jgi:hypothetical protein
MKGRIAIFAVVLAMLMLVGTEVIGVAEANPVPWLSTPNREKPTLTLQAPTNQTTYKTEVPVDFNVTAPESWATYATRLVGTNHYVGEVKYIAVYLDSKPLINYTTGRIVSYFYGNKTNYYISGFDGKSAHYSFNLNQTTSGSHMLNVTVFSYTYADGDPIDDTAIAFQTGSINGEPIYAYKYPNVVSEVVDFTVEQPTPTQSMPTINTGAKLPVELNLPIVYIILAIAIVIVAIASISLVYFKRHKCRMP